METDCITEVATLKEQVAEITALAKRLGATFMYARFKEIAKFTNVSVNLPVITSGYLQKVKAHTLWIAGSASLKNDPERVPVSAHYYFSSLHGGKKLHRHFYTNHLEDFGKTLVAKEVRVKLKTNFWNGAKSLILDIVPLHANGAPEWKLKIGSNDPMIDVQEKFQIPGTNEFVGFKKI